jgi:uncharacterized protein (DUF1697 family)
MAALKAAFGDFARRVQTYIQSGNVVFLDSVGAKLVADLEAMIAAH